MTKSRSLFTGLVISLLIGISVGIVTAVSGCAAPGADPNAVTAAGTHFKADLASGFYAVETVRAGAAAAVQARVITIAQANAVRTQCAAFTATLKSLQASGQTPNSQDALTATLDAIKAATVFVSTSSGEPKP